MRNSWKWTRQWQYQWASTWKVCWFSIEKDVKFLLPSNLKRNTVHLFSYDFLRLLSYPVRVNTGSNFTWVNKEIPSESIVTRRSSRVALAALSFSIWPHTTDECGLTVGGTWDVVWSNTYDEKWPSKFQPQDFCGNSINIPVFVFWTLETVYVLSFFPVRIDFGCDSSVTVILFVTFTFLWLTSNMDDATAENELAVAVSLTGVDSMTLIEQLFVGWSMLFLTQASVIE